MAFRDLDEALEELGYGRGNSRDDLTGFRFFTHKPPVQPERVLEQLATAWEGSRIAAKRRRMNEEKRLEVFMTSAISNVAARSVQVKRSSAFIARLQKENLVGRARMICHGRDIPENPEELLCPSNEEARVDLVVALFVTQRWDPSRIARLFGEDSHVAWVKDSLRSRNFVVLP